MGKRRGNLLRFLAVMGIVCGLVVLGGGRSVSAQGPFPVVASNLDNPRGLAFGPDGALYIAEAGRGGTAPCVDLPPPLSTKVCYGASGAITRVRNGMQERIASGMPSIAGEGGAGATGPHDVSVLPNGEVYAVVGLGANPDARAAFGPAGANFGQLVRVAANGSAQNVADIAAYEKTANPDGDPPDSNPYAVLAMPDRRIVIDAGGNTALQVAADGAISTVATFPKRVVKAPPIPNLPPELPMQAVPTTVAMGPDGALYVGQLTGFPFPVGGANVYRIAPGGQPTVYAEGFSAIIDLTFGPDGSLYVLEIFTKGVLQAEQEGGDPSGALIRVTPDGKRTTIASAGLIAPGGVAIGPDGGIYVSNFSILPGQGMVVRVGRVSTTPLPETAVDGAPVTFPETGYSLQDEFLDFWTAHGGLAVFGFPIDSERMVSGQVSQWLERARFEKHPENAAPYHVLLSRLGVQALEAQGRNWRDEAKASPDAAHYFPETGHAISYGPFWSFWSSHGLEFDKRNGKSYAESLALFGMPITEARMETNAGGERVLTQWFERARFEYHPDNPAAYRVLLGRLGAEVKHTRGR